MEVQGRETCLGRVRVPRVSTTSLMSHTLHRGRVSGQVEGVACMTVYSLHFSVNVHHSHCPTAILTEFARKEGSSWGRTDYPFISTVIYQTLYHLSQDLVLMPKEF